MMVAIDNLVRLFEDLLFHPRWRGSAKLVDAANDNDALGDYRRQRSAARR